MTAIGSFAILFSNTYSGFCLSDFFFPYRKMTTEGGTIFVFSEKSLQMWPRAFKQTDTGRIIELSERPHPPSNWKQPMPVNQQLRNSSRKNHVILAHGEGSDYSVVSLCQKCHDISMRQAVKQTSLHCLLQERVRGYGAYKASWLLLASLCHSSWMQGRLHFCGVPL